MSGSSTTNFHTEDQLQINYKDYEIPLMTLIDSQTPTISNAGNAPSSSTVLKDYSGLTMGDIERLFPYVPKFELAEDIYKNRSDSALKFLQLKKQEDLKKLEDLKKVEKQEDVNNLDLNIENFGSDAFQVGDAVILLPGNRFGHIRYIGPFHKVLGNALWYGVELNEPNGKHNGTIEEHQYFVCQPNHGIMVRKEALRLANSLYQEDGHESESDIDMDLVL